MKDIKFRIWDKKNTKFISKWERVFINAWECCVYTKSELEKKDFSYNKDLSEIEVEQFTGLKDKHGKEIYEGDIVKFDYRGLFLKGEVVFSNGGWELKGVDYGEHFRLIEIVHLCEVVGNIHENPELIGGAK